MVVRRMAEYPYSSDGEHNFRWRYPSGRVSWTYRDRVAAEAALPRARKAGLVLERSDDNGQTWSALGGGE